MEFRGIIVFSCFLLVVCAESVWSPAASHSYSQSSGHCLFPQCGLVHKYSVGVHGAAAYAVPALMDVDPILFRSPRLCGNAPLYKGSPYLARSSPCQGRQPTMRKYCPFCKFRFQAAWRMLIRKSVLPWITYNHGFLHSLYFVSVLHSSANPDL